MGRHIRQQDTRKRRRRGENFPLKPIRRGSIDYPVNISDEPIRIIANNCHRRCDTSAAFVTTIIRRKRDSHDALIFILQDRDFHPVLRALFMERLVSLSIIPDKAERFD